MNRQITKVVIGLALLAAGTAGADPVTTVVPRLVSGEDISALLRADGTVETWGYNNFGSLGLGDTVDRLSPTTIESFAGINDVATGWYHMLAIGIDGTLSVWGWNWYGQLGLGNSGGGTDRLTPTQVPGLTGVVAASGGYGHSLVRQSNGAVFAWGRNDYGQLGLGNTINRSTPTKIAGLTDVAAINAGAYHSFILKADGSLLACGRNDYGQLGLGDTTDRSSPNQIAGLTNVIAISGGALHSVALKADGSVWTWGYNQYGQLGLGDTDHRSTPTQITDLTGVIAISTGFYHSLALKADGSVWAWGVNWYGQLGLGDTTNRSIPTQIIGLNPIVTISGGYNQSLALKADGSAWAWGHNNYGQLGLGDTTNRWTPTQIAAAEHVPSTLTPARVEFGTIERGADLTPQSVTFQVTTGSMNLNFAKDALGVDVGAPGLFSGYTPGTCTSGPMSDASGSCQFDLGGKITGATGLRVGHLAIPADGTLAKAVVLTATANITGSWLKADRSTVDFGKRALNTPVDEIVTFRNRGTADVAISAVQTTGIGFSVAEEDCTAAGGVLNPGATCAVTVRHTATRGGQYSGQLAVTTDSAVPVIRLSLTGLGDAPRLIRSQARFDFGTVPKDTTSEPQTLTLSNTGAQVLNLTSFNLARPGPFGIVGNTCGATLEPAASCAVTLQYAPRQRMTHRNRAILVTNDPNNPTLSFPLTGTGG